MEIKDSTKYKIIGGTILGSLLAAGSCEYGTQKAVNNYNQLDKIEKQIQDQQKRIETLITATSSPEKSAQLTLCKIENENCDKQATKKMTMNLKTHETINDAVQRQCTKFKLTTGKSIDDGCTGILKIKGAVTEYRGIEVLNRCKQAVKQCMEGII